MYQGQKVHLFRPSVSFPAEAQSRLEAGEDKRHVLGEVHIKFFRRPHITSFKKLHIYFVITFFKNVDKISSTYVLIIFFIVFFYQLANKTRNLQSIYRFCRFRC
jgi:hypothetical protein